MKRQIALEAMTEVGLVSPSSDFTASARAGTPSLTA